jgi:hypothetical protein
LLATIWPPWTRYESAAGIVSWARTQQTALANASTDGVDMGDATLGHADWGVLDFFTSTRTSPTVNALSE